MTNDQLDDAEALLARLMRQARRYNSTKANIAQVRGVIIGALAGGHLEGSDGPAYAKGVLIQIADLLDFDLPNELDNY